MIDRLWEEAVLLEGQTQNLKVRSTRDALLCLTNHWPVKDGPSQVRAEEICRSVLSGASSPDDARTAFIEAAKDADFQVRSWSGS